jgi:hypothetical protein
MTRCNKKQIKHGCRTIPRTANWIKDDAPSQNLDRDPISTSSDCGPAGLSTAHDALQQKQKFGSSAANFLVGRQIF